MRFSLRLNFVLFTAHLEDDGRGIIMASPSIFIHRWAAARSLNNISDIFLKASIRVVVYIGELPANPKGNSVSPFFNSPFPLFSLVSPWFERRATVSPSLCNLLHMHNRQVLRIGDKNWNVCQASRGFTRPVMICRSCLLAPHLFGRPRWPLERRRQDSWGQDFGNLPCVVCALWNCATIRNTPQTHSNDQNAH